MRDRVRGRCQPPGGVTSCNAQPTHGGCGMRAPRAPASAATTPSYSLPEATPGGRTKGIAAGHEDHAVMGELGHCRHMEGGGTGAQRSEQANGAGALQSCCSRRWQAPADAQNDDRLIDAQCLLAQAEPCSRHTHGANLGPAHAPAVSAVVSMPPP